jgi:hypothetical protein
MLLAGNSTAGFFYRSERIASTSKGFMVWMFINSTEIPFCSQYSFGFNSFPNQVAGRENRYVFSFNHFIGFANYKRPVG